MFKFLLDVLRLGEDMSLPQGERQGNVRLGELEDRKWGVFGPPRHEAFARLCEPLFLGEGRLHLGEPVTVLRHVFMACLGLISWPSL